MYKVLTITSLILIPIILIITTCHGVTSNSPKVSFHYSAAIDKLICTKEGKDRIKPAWHTELNKKLPWFEQAWNEMGTKLLTETVKELKIPFTYTQTQVRIFLCPELPGFSLPIMIPVSMYLESAVKKPWQRIEFVDMVYHEILHGYVSRALKWNYWTPLLRKYNNEDFNTKIHLHLFALQKSVYINLGMKDQWDFIVQRFNQLAPQYNRAIEIVDKEGYQPFLDELRK